MTTFAPPPSATRARERRHQALWGELERHSASRRFRALWRLAPSYRDSSRGITGLSRVSKRDRNRTGVKLAPVLLVAAWGVAWIASHASHQAYTHILFQTLALAESVTALSLRRRKPTGALVGIMVAYLAFQLDPLLLPPLLIALFTVAALTERRTALLATAATAAAVATLPLTGRGSVDLAGYLLPRMLAVATAGATGLWAQTHARKKTW